MQLVLIEKQRLYRSNLPEKCSGRYWLKRTAADGSEVDTIFVEGIAGKWILKSNRAAQVYDNTGNPVRECEIVPSSFYRVKFADQDDKVLIYVKPSTEDRRKFSKWLLPSSGSFEIGRSSACALHFGSPFASSSHATLSIENGTAYISDNASSNGTFLNDERIVVASKLKPGDMISIIDLTLVYCGGFFAANSPDGNFKVSGDFKPLFTPKADSDFDSGEIEESSPKHLFYRSPRMGRAITAPVVKIDAPPNEEKPDDTPLLMVLGPTMTMGLSSLTMAMFAVMNARQTGNYMMAVPMVVMSLLMMTGMILFPILQRRYQQNKRVENEIKRKEKYRAYLQKNKEQIAAEKQIQADILYENNVDLTECVNRIRERERSLWERTETHDDFLDVRLGIGNWPFEAEYQVPQRSFTLDDDTLQDELFEIIDAPRVVSEVPVVVSLVKQFSIGVIGKRFETVPLMRALIFQMAALHAYDEVKFVFIYNEQEREHWDFVRWLPHVWSDEKDFRFVATNVDEVRHLSSILEQLQSGPGDESESTTNQTRGQTKYLVFALDRKLATKCEALNTVFRAEEYHNISVMAVYDELRYLPKDCKVVLELNSDESKIFDRSVSTGEHIKFVPDKGLEVDANSLAMLLANTELESAEAAFTLPSMLTFLEMFEVGKIEHLNVTARWKESNPVLTLETPIGVDELGNLCNLDLHERAHGPHGLVAGMTGSGKSEFIMTYILSLALNYHPHEVAFVLIDYKGGGMALAFANLPHTVGVITNLDGASVNRSLASIQSELKRRQLLFNEAAQRTQVSNIDIYKYQSLFREGQVDEPLPHLFIISDEFAELKTQQPEFMEQLVSAARIGRSLGVHLILATQKPSGVVDDQIWANSKFKICLKVQDKADSMEMIKRPDAAELVEAGRYYLQVGYNELFEMGQSAWAGAAYFPSDRVERDYDDSVTLLDTQGRSLVQAKPQKAALVGGKTKQLDEVVNYLIATAKEESVSSRPLWMPPLGKRLYLDDLAKKYRMKTKTGFTLEALMGEYDDPMTQTQDAMSLSLTKDGNLLLFGVTGSGKTHFINTLTYSFIRDHIPEEVNCYLLDFGAETLTSFAPAPHVGDVLTSADEEKIENLFGFLNAELEQRKKLFLEYGGDFHGYIENSGKTVPNIVVVINNFANFTELYEEAGEWLGGQLLSAGTRYGIYFILAATSAANVPFRMQQNFGQKICLQVNDTDEYTEIFGRLEGLLPEQTPGRGLFRSNDGVFEFQSALISEELADSPRATRQFCTATAKAHKGAVAKPVPSLPDRVTAAFLDANTEQIEKRVVPVGVDKQSLVNLEYDFSSQPATLIMSSTDGYQDFLASLVEQICKVRPKTVTYLGGAGDAFADKLGSDLKIVTLSVDDIVAAGAEGGELPKTSDWLVVAGLSAVYDALPYEQKEPFIKGLQRIVKENKTTILWGDNAGNFSSIAYESWLQDFTALDSGIWIGNGFGDQFFLKPSGGSYYEDIGGQFGYLLQQGEVSLAKMLQGEES